MLRVHNRGGAQKEDHVSYTITQQGGLSVAVIPSSEELDDWFKSCPYWRTGTIIQDVHYKVHAGILEQSQDVFDAIQDCDLLIGHAAGGAIAQVCALRMRRPVITFGSPRVGGKKFARDIRPFHTRVMNPLDSYVRAPHWCRGYRHGGTQVCVGDSRRGHRALVRARGMHDYVQLNCQTFKDSDDI